MSSKSKKADKEKSASKAADTKAAPEEMPVDRVDIPLDDVVSKLAAARRKATKKADPKVPSPPPKAAVDGVEAAPKAAAPKTTAVDGVECARLRRLARAGYKAPGRCALLGILLDVGPRANCWQRPRWCDGEQVSELALAIIESGVPPKALEQAAAALRPSKGDEL